MRNKHFAGILLLTLCFAMPVRAFDKSYQEQWTKRLDEVTQNFLLLNKVGSFNRRDKFDFPQFKDAEIHIFLKSEFGDVYTDYHSDIVHYINVLTNRPKFQLRIWYTIVNQFEKNHFKRNRNTIVHLVASRLEFPQYSLNDSWLTHPIVALNYGNKPTEFVDNRRHELASFRFRKAHFEDLKNQGLSATEALSMCVLGSASISRIPKSRGLNYWKLYPDIKSDQRDFFAVMLASAFVLNAMEQMEIEPFTFEPKNKYISVEPNFVLHLGALAKFFNFEEEELRLINGVFFRQIVPKLAKLRLPNQFATIYSKQEVDLGLSSAYIIHKIKAPYALVKYRVKTNDNLSKIAQIFSVKEDEILKINFITSDNIEINQMLFIKVLQTDSLNYSAFDSLSIEEIEQIKIAIPSPTINPSNNTSRPSTQKIHVVKSGETLSHIARKYGVSVKQIKDWNKLKSDNIQIGQKIIIKK
jgi:LysM repeat protein